VLLEVPSGIAADRWGRKITLLAGAGMHTIGCVVFAVSYDFWIFAVGEVLFAASTALVSGADSALLYDSLAAEKRQSEYPRAEGAAQFSWLFMSALALPLTDVFLVVAEDPIRAYWVTAALGVVGFGFACFMIEPPAGRRQTLREITFGAARDVVRLPGVLRIIAYSVGLFLLLRAAMVNFYNPVLEACGIAVHRYGTIFAVVNLAGALSVALIPRARARFGERAVLIAFPAGMIFMFLALIPLRTPMAAALFLIQGAAFGAYPLLVRTILNRRIPSPERRATILSMESMACRIAFAVVTILADESLGRLGLSIALGATLAASCIPFLLMQLAPKYPETTPTAPGPDRPPGV